MIFAAAAALVISCASCSSEKKADAAQDSTAVATEQVAAAPEEGANADLNAAVAAVIKKIDNKETLTDADFSVAIDYMTAMFEEINKNPTDVEGIMAKFPEAEKLNAAFENFDMNQASPETKAKLEKMQELK